MTYRCIEGVILPWDLLVLFVSKTTAVGAHDGFDRLRNALTRCTKTNSRGPSKEKRENEEVSKQLPFGSKFDILNHWQI